VTQTAQPRIEPLPGYVAIERIGSGGYGEVWKANAPGGVEKAVKTLHGYHNEELAARELKALERIKDVRHPFLLSLDRFEIHTGRLVVVMELADMSLEQCFQLHRAEQRDGIPREELISYLRDAAEALDYMQQNHDLQHLDIKPENLLLLGKHVKVADFGLVKEVAGHTLNSMVGGMTPTYAAPEIFDNRPSTRTDQYSLAIVYQEMLTGVLPFPGRTAAQLVAQHTQGKPRVAALSDQDRPIVLKALAKDPSQRYASCSEFIDALAGDRGGSNHHWAAASTRTTDKDLSNEETQDVSSYQTEPIPRPASPVQRNATEAMPADHPSENDSPASPSSSHQHAEQDHETPDRSRRDNPNQPAKPSPGLELKDRCSGKANPSGNDPPTHQIVVSTQVEELPAPELPTNPCILQPALVIGLGGIGGNVLQQLQKHCLQRGKDIPWPKLVPMLALDLDQDDLKDLRKKVVNTSAGPLVDTLLMPLRRPQQYKTCSPDLLHWLSRRWLYNIPRSLKTRGYRPLGRLSLVDNTKLVLKTLNLYMKRLADSQQVEEIAAAHELTCRDKPLRVVLVASTSGGTGSGIAVDLAHAVRKVASACGVADIEVVGMFVDCSREGTDANDLTAANSYAFLTEYETACQLGNRNLEDLPEEMTVFEGESSPFDHMYYSSLGDSEAGHSVESWIEQTAQYLAVDLFSSAGPLLNVCRRTQGKSTCNEHETSQLRCFSLAPLSKSLDENLQTASAHLCQQVARYWLADPIASNNRQIQGQRQGKFGRFSKRRKVKKILRKKTFQRNIQLQHLDREILETFSAAPIGNFMILLADLLEGRLLETELCLTPEGEPILPACFRSTIRSAHEQFSDTLHRLEELSADDSPNMVGENRHEEEIRLRQDPMFGDEEMLDLASRVGQEVCRCYLQTLESVGEEELPKLLAILQQTATKSLKQLVATGDPSNLIARLADAVPDLGMVTRRLDASPPQCGHGRHLVVVIPQHWPNDSLDMEARRALPDAAILRAHVTRPLVLYEAANLSLAQAATRLTESRPDAIEAAKRLYTRNDIQWTSLPHVVSE
jgi:serine/threonine protein kinase